MPPRLYAVLAALSPEGRLRGRRYPAPEGSLPTCCSPFCRFTLPPKRDFSLDLHVLGTPPAFILSQDQTLQFDLFKTQELDV